MLENKEVVKAVHSISKEMQIKLKNELEFKLEINDIEEMHKNISDQVKSSEKLLRQNFGKVYEFFHLKDECFTYEDKVSNYAYTLCFFKDLT